MYASQRNVQILVSLLKQHNIRHAVLSPGSRNMAIVASMENDPWFTCYSVVDERSAGYFAVGVSLSNDAPVVLSCTSAQATRNYIPAMTESYYRGVPLVVVTADYRIERIGQGIMQSLDQMSIPHDAARTSVRLPLVRDSIEEAYCTRLVNQAILDLDHHGRAPVHIDIPIDEHWVGGVERLPVARKIERHTNLDTVPSLEGRRVLVAVGQHTPFTGSQTEALEGFCRSHDAAVYVNHISNYHGLGAANVNLALESIPYDDFTPYVPDVLITIGGQIGDYAFDGQHRNRDLEHWQVGPSGVLLDTYDRLTQVFECMEEEFFRALAEPEEALSRPYTGLWEGLRARRIPGRLPLSHALVALEAAPKIPAGSVMHFGILSSFRNWCYFDIDPSIECYSNVAGFGIDGGLSTFVGHAVDSKKLSILVIGDLSFFYDMNAVGIRHMSPNVRVLLVNNGGGGEFRLYSHAAAGFGESANRHIAAGGHFGSARGWVESMGWNYASVDSPGDLAGGLDKLVGESDAPMLLEVFTTMERDSEGVRLMRETNGPRTLRKSIKRKVPSSVRRAVKRRLRGL